MNKPDKQEMPAKRRIMPLMIGVVVFCLFAFCFSFIILQQYKIQLREEKQAAENMAESVNARLQQSLQYSLSATQALTLTIDKQGIPRNFDSIAAYILHSNKYMDALQLVPNGVIQYVYPMKGNEKTIGHNILKDPTRNIEAKKAIEKKELFFAGPFSLRQGGIGVVGRLPVFRNNKFWGFSGVVIHLSTLMQAAGIDSTGRNGYYFQLSKLDPYTNKVDTFLPFPGKSPGRHNISVSIPNGEWNLSVTPVNGYKALGASLPMMVLALLVCVTTGMFATHLSRMPARLQQKVAEQTAELERNEKRNRAIINALPDIYFVIDRDGRYIDFNNPRGSELILREHIISRKMSEVLPEGIAAEAMIYLEKALNSGEVHTHSYQTLVKGETRSYEARYVAQTQSEVLVLVRDTTDSILAAEKVKESELKYRTLVEQASDGIFIADFRGNFIIINPAGCRMCQFTEAELLKMRMHDLAIASEIQAVPFKFAEILEGKTVSSERKLVRKDGSVIEIEITAKIIGPDRFLSFIRDITERKKVEQELILSRENLRELSNHIENIREEERLHIAREIHDELGQQLTVLKMDVARIDKKLADEQAEMTADTQKILGLINKMVDTVRKISSELRPGMLDDLGLIEALDWYCHDFGKRFGLKTNFISNIQETRFPKKLTIGIFRILQESMTNVARHAEASKVDVTFIQQHEQLILLIEDNGKGFDPQASREKKTLGIMGMQERAIMINGSYKVNSQPGKGTIIEVTVNLDVPESINIPVNLQ
jgi:PAS domain S-box-containing protein